MQDYCSRVSEPGLSLGCAKTLSNIIYGLNGSATPTELYMDNLMGKTYDGLVWDADWIAGHGEKRLRFKSDVKFLVGEYKSWKNIYIGSTRSDGQKTAVDMVSLPQSSINHSDSNITLHFDRLTLENTALTLKHAASADGRQTGVIDYLTLGSAGAGQGGRMTMRNSSLNIWPDTKLLINAPSGATYIRAESGDNLLKLETQSINAKQFYVDIKDSAKLTLSHTKLIAQQEGSLHIEKRASLNLKDESILQLLQSNVSSLPQSTVTNGEITIDGGLSELRITAPLFSDSKISLINGGALRIQERGNERSSMSFVGNNTLHFDHGDSTVLGATVHPNHLTLNVGRGTTTLTGVIPNAKHGLQVDNVNIDRGTLDITSYGANAGEWRSLTVKNNGILFDRLKEYNQLENLEVNTGTLKSLSKFGSFAYKGIATAKLTNSKIDLVSALGEHNLQMPPGLQAVHISAKSLEFSGSNQVLVGIHPSGQDSIYNGSPIPNTRRYAGELVVNIGNDPNSKLIGFDTVLFVPKAMDKTAKNADYVSGGINKVYTVAEANISSHLISDKKSFDAAPITPTAMQLAAAGSDLPANLIYTIANDPVADERVDITFIDLTLKHHPKLATHYTPQFISKVFVNPNSKNTHAVTVSILPNLSVGTSKSWSVTTPTTNNVVSISQKAISAPGGTVSHVITTTVTAANGHILSTNTVTVPSSSISGGAVQLVTTTVTNQSGVHVRTTSVGAPMNKPTGTGNTYRLASLMSLSSTSLSSASLNAVEVLHPETYASFMTVALEYSMHLRNLVLVNARGNAGGSGQPYGDLVEGFTDSGHRVWMDASKLQGDMDPKNDLIGFDYSMGGVIFGADIWSNEECSAGAFIGYGDYSMDEKSSSLSSLSSFGISSKILSVGGYGSYDIPNWSIIGMTSYSWANTDAKRVITSDTFKGDYKARVFETSVRAEYTSFRTNDPWRIMPEIGCGYINYNQESFTETGPQNLILNIKDTTVESLTGSIALNLTGPVFGYGLKPYAFIRYEHDFLAAQKKEHKIYASFASTPNISESFIGTHRGPDAIVTGIGLRGAVSDSVDLSAGIIYKKQTYGKEYGGGLQVTRVF
ncbi:MAG: autotransporter domain-containing protein [Candidatus Endonucleobacter sp. (ex Gigantidas childressi)]|nr:autotransporter domain-containing protein [Candidatus Endonucleobacter sp. (ex Gigantidas childressi)]